MAEVLAVNGLVKEFEQRVGTFRRAALHAVDDVTLSVGGEDCVGVVGESGCGKSTLARMMVGLERPTGGSVRFRGTEVVDEDGWKALRRSVQYVFQDPYGSLPPKMTIGAVLEDPLKIAGVAAAQRRARVTEVLELVGLQGGDVGRYPSEFSGGQRQRISVARALLLKPDVVIFDEVTSGLDVSIQAQVLNLLVELQAELGLGYVFISHDLRVIRYLSRSVIVMYLGKVVEAGPVEQIFVDPQHPYTQGLLRSIPDHRREVIEGSEHSLTRIAGELPSPVDRPPGCAFAPRCPRAQDRCRAEDPAERTLGPVRVRCHFPGAGA
jgi:oligopeptide/dipeptide ABC transporter ATP-binding protein